MSEKERAPFVDQANRDKARYMSQLEELKETGSYFTLADGSKSTDERNKKLFKAQVAKQGDGSAPKKEQGTVKAEDSGTLQDSVGKAEAPAVRQPKKPSSAYIYHNAWFVKN